MMDIIFWVIVGAFVGWNMPQPWYAKTIQNWILTKIKNITTKE